MSNFRLSEKEAPWITDLTNDQMGNITTWVREVTSTSTALGYTVQDETIFTMNEMEHNDAEKKAQLQCYDALIGGYHGTKGERRERGY
eukprot:2627196-Heterocapsa_arctica.AAC.1